MLEESAMDKKPAPAPSSVAKGCGSNGSQEKKHRGGGFAKRSNGGNGQSRQFDGGYGRKPLPQKTKALDKRPRSRGGYSENAKGRSEIAKEDRDVEFFSSAQPGSKKHNLNHLLNFTLAPREGDTALGGRGFNSGGLPAWRRRQKWGHSKVKYNKEQFLQANCQFVVQDSGDYTVHAANPDTLVDWSLVEQIRIFGHEVPSCPICLYPPTAAKMTRCGHIYCWSCILHYLALSDKPWRKCPICDEAIHNSDLKSVVVLETHQFSAGDEVSMKLMRRERGSVLAMPRAHWQSAAGKPFCEKDVADLHSSMKLLSVSGARNLDSIVSRERTALETQYAVEKQYSESCFIQSALTHLEQREAALRMRQSPPATKPKPVGEESRRGGKRGEKGLEGSRWCSGRRR
ncbi:PREDICTED: RING finger protein 10-like [Priapulus caudatus]|uniref:E3 ubiquitin-protein ligase RNF10 n=1 Tax=Priapulus caudatus TaxID=37621 RepID=A0ABM1EYW0_PRICU|nr:PREDICTED: RING finger protein 10-like [Priapulus caudatus]